MKFLNNSFKGYYYNNFDAFQLSDNIYEHEFGYQTFDYEGMKRHMLFDTINDFKVFLIRDVPSDIYCSNARYNFPNLPLNEKDMKTADLIFDIDAKDFNLPCRESHSISICNDCHNISSGFSCNNCKSKKCTIKSILCKDCINATKKETKYLINILVDDFCIDISHIHVYFSGNEGFHIHVTDPKIQHINKKERVELIDYLMFKGVIPESFGMKKHKPNKNDFPNMDDFGWRGRFAKHVYGSKSKRNKVIKDLIEKGYQRFQYKLNELSNIMGVKIDPNVTSDINRIFRMPGSINSKSGMSKIKIKDDLMGFDPESAMMCDGDDINIICRNPISLNLFGKRLKPMNGDKVKVPLKLAVYMICKGIANIK